MYVYIYVYMYLCMYVMYVCICIYPRRADKVLTGVFHPITGRLANSTQTHILTETHLVRAPLDEQLVAAVYNFRC